MQYFIHCIFDFMLGWKLTFFSPNFLQFVSDKLSRKILNQALEQQDELEAEYGASRASRIRKPLKEARTSLGPATANQIDFGSSDDDSEDDNDQLSDGSDQHYEDVVRNLLN